MIPFDEALANYMDTFGDSPPSDVFFNAGDASIRAMVDAVLTGKELLDETPDLIS